MAAKFDMNRAWNGAVRLMKANFQLLAVIGGIFLLVPTLAIYVFFPDMPTMADIQAETPEQMQAAMLEVLPQLAPFIVLTSLLQFFASLAMIALMGHQRPTVGEALSEALRALPSAIATMLLTALIAMFFIVIASLIGAVLALAIGQGAATALLLMAAVVAGLYLSIRLIPTFPILAIEQQRNPVTVIRKAWRMTAHDAWRILGFYALLMLAYLVISMLLSGVLMGLQALSSDTDQFLTGVIDGLISVVVTIVSSAIMVSIYRQLRDREATAAD